MTDDEKAIRALVQDWMRASKAGDLAAVMDMVTDDIQFMVVGREPFGREAFTAKSEGQKTAQIDGTAETVEVGFMGEGWAWMRNHLRIEVTPSGGSMMVKEGYTLTILRKCSDGKWRIMRDANLLIEKE